jgi:hypothetical protein
MERISDFLTLLVGSKVGFHRKINQIMLLRTSNSSYL